MEPVHMDDKTRLQLQNMVKANNAEDQTSLIRELKHSDIFKKEIATLLSLKEKYANDQDKLHMECMIECSFLFNYYTDLYNKIRKDEIDMKILYQFLDVLKQIEDGMVDQHEGSFMVGTLLKKIYVDSALKKAEKLDKEHAAADAANAPAIIREDPVEISWKQFKRMKKA
jgi:hypothetical protein